MPPKGVIPCVYSRPAGNKTDLVIVEIVPPHHLAGSTVICNCHGQEYLTRLEVNSPVLVKSRLRESEKNPGDYLGDACSAFMQPTSESYVAPDEELETSEVTVLPASRELLDDSGVTRDFTIELSNHEHIEIFRQYSLKCKRGYKEAGRKLIGFAIDQLSAAKQFDLTG